MDNYLVAWLDDSGLVPVGVWPDLDDAKAAAEADQLEADRMLLDQGLTPTPVTLEWTETNPFCLEAEIAGSGRYLVYAVEVH